MNRGKKILNAGILLFTLLLSIILFIYSKFQSKNIDIGIIGGSDGPTQIYLSSGNDELLTVAGFIVIISFLLMTLKAYIKLRQK